MSEENYNEEAEQIDEISDAAKAEYNKKNNEKTRQKTALAIDRAIKYPDQRGYLKDLKRRRIRGAKLVGQLNNEETEIDESAGSDTLKPGSQGGTKTEMLATFTSLLAQLGKEDLTSLFNDSIKKYSPDNVPSATAPGKTGMPQMAMAKLGVKEDLDAMFASDSDLTEDFKERASTIFEAAIELRANLEIARLEEEYSSALEEEVATIKEDLSTKVDQYLNYVVEQWIEENEIAIETSLRADIAEDFMQGLYNLFAESNIHVPEEKIDVLGELHDKILELESALDESINSQLELKAIINEAEKEAAFDEVCEGLAATQVEKLRTLAEGVEFNDMASYSRKLDILKDKYFTEKKITSTNIITETVEASQEPAASVPAEMSQYVSAISKSLK